MTEKNFFFKKPTVFNFCTIYVSKEYRGHPLKGIVVQKNIRLRPLQPKK